MQDTTTEKDDKMKCEICGKKATGGYLIGDNWTNFVQFGFCDECFKNKKHDVEQTMEAFLKRQDYARNNN